MGNRAFFILVFILGLLTLKGLTDEIHEKSRIDLLRFKRSTRSTNTRRRFNLDAYKVASEKEDNCTRLPLDYKRTNVSHEHVSFADLMDGKFDNMISSHNHKDVILIMGNTGVGKTVITQIIAGDLNRIHAVNKHVGGLVIIDDSERISAPSTVSRTLVPELVLPTNNRYRAAFYDCPGFDDTRGAAQDVATNFFMNQIVRKVARVKILFLVTSTSVSLGHDRVDFDSLAQHATTFVKNMTSFKDSIGLVVTKVKNYSEMGEYRSDNSIMLQVLEFLSKYYETLETTLETLSQINDSKSIEKIQTIKHKIEFVDILLKMDTNGNYSRIAFSRDPENCGPLSKSVEVGKTKKRVENLYKTLQFSNVGNYSANFGFSIKPETALEITTNYVPELNQKIVQKISNLTSDFNVWFDDKGLDMAQYTTKLAANLNKIVEQTSNAILKILMLRHSPLISLKHFGSTMESSFKQIGYSVPQEFTDFWDKQEIMFEFFENVVGREKAERRINNWLVPIAGLHTTILEYKSWYEFCVKLQEIVTSYDFQKKKMARINTNWLEFIERNQLVSLNQNIKLLASKFGESGKPVQLLHKIMNYATVPTNKLCNGNSLIATGHILRLSDFLDTSGALLPICNSFNDENPKTINVYASSTIFIDQSVNAVGLELNLVLIAPKWEVVGRSQYINLDGKAATDHSPMKALDGDAGDRHRKTHFHTAFHDIIKCIRGCGNPGGRGEDGLAGKAGGPGGSFFGILSKIRDGDKLKISTNGGNGGAGQNGGDGERGDDGYNADADITDTKAVLPLIIYNGVWTRRDGRSGYKGGNGGDGGVGGPGGFSGNVEIRSVETSSINVAEQVSMKMGETGKFGLGGLGGPGGKHGNGEKCYKNFVVFIPVGTKCETLVVNERASDGASGVNNISQKWYDNAEPSSVVIDKIGSISNFKKMFALSSDDDVRKFISKI